MRMRLFRLAFPDQSLTRTARRMKDLQRCGDINSEHLRPCVAYESAELAAMCSSELLWSVRRKTELLRETVTLPGGTGLHGLAPAAVCESFDAQYTPSLPLVEHMVAHGLLSLWVPSAHAGHQHAVFINPCHAAFADIVIEKRHIVLTRPPWSGYVESSDRMMLAAGIHTAEPAAPSGLAWRWISEDISRHTAGLLHASDG